MGLVLAILLATDALQPARPKPRREKKNKYAQFSKADDVRKSLRFSRLDSGPEKGVTPAQEASPAAEQPRERNVWLYPDAASVDQRDPTTFGFVEIGRVLGAHGVRGELKVATESDFALERLCKPGPRWLRRPRRRAPREVRLVHGRTGPGSNVFIVRLEGVGGREDAQALKGARLFSRQEVAPELRADELRVSQLEGLEVALVRLADEEEAQREPEPGEVVGRVVGYVPREELTGSPELGHDLLEVELARREGDGDEGSEDAEAAPDTVLVPYVPQIVPSVLLERGLLLVDPPPGLLELVQPKRKERVVIRGLLPERAQSLQGISGTPDISLM